MSDLEIWQLLVAAFAIVVTVVGWLYEKAKDRQHEIFKERLKRRLDMYDSVIVALLPFANAANANDSVNLSASLKKDLETARTKMQLFGYNDEKESFERFISTIPKKDMVELNKCLKQLIPLIPSKLRSELGYK